MFGGIITFTSDFGTADGYVGAVKGVILSRGADVRVVDLSHDIPPGDVAAAAFCLRVAAPEFPEGTVHLAVVDPGVGGGRRAVIVRKAGHTFVGPDNGLFAMVAGEVVEAWEIDPGRPRRARRVSHTFHGRDVFAPVAADLALGKLASDIGSEIDPAGLVKLDLDEGWHEEGGLALGRVLHVDRFGNLVTSLPCEVLARACGAGGTAGGRPVLAPVASYEAIPAGAAAFIAGSQGLVEISMRGRSAAAHLGLGLGDEVRLATGGGR
jgi:S-adenosylmethionine hydrolase